MTFFFFFFFFFTYVIFILKFILPYLPVNIIIALNPTYAREIRRINHPNTQIWSLVVGPLAGSRRLPNPPANTVQASYFLLPKTVGECIRNVGRREGNI